MRIADVFRLAFNKSIMMRMSSVVRQKARKNPAKKLGRFRCMN